MLRLYKPIEHDIFKLHDMLRHLVCSVWCEACDDECRTKLEPDFKKIYDSYRWLRDAVDEIYASCKNLGDDKKAAIKTAFEINNSIEQLCDGAFRPVYLHELPGVVGEKMKPLLVQFYEKLLDQTKVPGTKKDYYAKLIEENGFKKCPCCGMLSFEPPASDNREAFDHYLPKALYPFASVNFLNLVPLCYKCNSDRKKVKDPIENGRRAFYPFQSGEHHVEIAINIDHSKDLSALERKDVNIEIIGDVEKTATWDSLFDIKERYNDTVRDFTKDFLRRIKRRHDNDAKYKINWTYTDSLNYFIDDYEYDKYDDDKFLKIPFMKEIKNFSHLIEVYG